MFSIKINGIVQGVGFRPFVYNLADQLKLKGYVLNSNEGVEIEVEGTHRNLEIFVESINKHHPIAARIDRFDLENLPDIGYKDFEIRQSSKKAGSTFISPDLRMCHDCISEHANPENKRYNYPFINCTNCGPRYSIIEHTPYDRPFTSMKDFIMCSYCRNEFGDPSNRRFHAQPIACPDCGPELSFLDGKLQKIPGDPIINCREELKKGKIVGIKGIGGFHIACDATNEDAVMELRRRKNRPAKPFAVMCNSDYLSLIVESTASMLRLLKSPQAPIIILPKAKTNPIVDSVAPHNSNLGVFLPYAPHHLQLFSSVESPNLIYLVMTSGNVNDEPIAKNEEELCGLCDFFLTHNRPILNRCDDSIVLPSAIDTILVRRSRGYVPSPLKLPFKTIPTLGTGAELKISFCLTDNDLLYLSPYIGNNNSKATEDFFTETLHKYQDWFRVKPELVGCDLHPDYLTTRFAQGINLPLIKIQHHHAHIAAVMAENKLDEPVIGISYDGTGYGDDGAIWGGEVFTADYSGYERRYHLNYLPLPGGDSAVVHPVRIAYAYLESNGIDCEFLKGISPLERKVIKQQIDNNFNLHQTSSMGRLFDCVSAMLGLVSQITFEAQSALTLEQLCNKSSISDVHPYPYQLVDQEINIISLIKAVRQDIVNGASINLVALKFHKTIIEFTLSAVLEVNRETALDKVVLSGGVMQNMVLFEGLVNRLRKKNFAVYYSSMLPANDGAIAVGQALIANRSIK
ncbi:MAG: carbamoyltransferase HypF [Candidatus Cloacimonadaceae bacterium]|nr:carbamoyltransferase HypF [Candidatus Cloacimonadaceae bacterium]MDP3113425.1 carbamoyltransferase HypF [Candidatus Cloacimonadaceae bacterium]